jgi:hypothetical protein
MMLNSDKHLFPFDFENVSFMVEDVDCDIFPE